MAYRITDEPENKHGGDNSGRDSLNFVPEEHHVTAVDSPASTDSAGKKVAAQEQEAEPEEARNARRGASWALQGGGLKGDNLPFTPTAGLFTSGPSVAEPFRRAIQDSGGVRQGDTWQSDPAPGVARVTVPYTIDLEKLHKQNQGSGNTFETQRRQNWVKDKWG